MITTVDTVFVIVANVTPICILDRLLSRVANIGVSNENSCYPYPIYIYFCSLESRVWVLGSNQKLQIHFTFRFKGLLFHLYGTEKVLFKTFLSQTSAKQLLISRGLVEFLLCSNFASPTLFSVLHRQSAKLHAFSQIFTPLCC